MKTCKGCDFLIVEVNENVYNFWCTSRKEIIYRSLDDIKEIPSPLGCIYAKECE